MSPEKTDSDLFRRCGDETHEASILYPSIARWEGFFPSHRFLFCVVNWNWTLVLGDCFALRRKVLSREGKYPKFSGAVPRSPFCETLLSKYVFLCGKEYLADPLYSWPRALRPTWSKTGLESSENEESQCFFPNQGGSPAQEVQRVREGSYLSKYNSNSSTKFHKSPVNRVRDKWPCRPRRNEAEP